MLSPIEPVRAFGVFAAAGILFCMLWSLTFIPAALMLVDPRRMERPNGVSDPGWLRRGILPLIRRRRMALGAVLLISAAAGLGMGRLYIQGVNDRLHTPMRWRSFSRRFPAA